MVKKMVFACLLMTPLAQCTGWLDDMVASYDKAGAFDRAEALAIIEGYRERDDKKRIELEEAAKKSDTSGVWGSVRSGSYQAELALLRNKIDYYKKVARAILEFPENKKQQESFTHALKKLSRYRKRLEELRSKYRAGSWGEKIKVGIVLAAKETQLASYKSYVKNILI